MAGEQRFTKLGTYSSELDIAWQDRLDDADSLLSSGRFAASISMALYALEICLKSRICRRLDLDQLPKAFEIHDLDGLLVLSGLSRKLNKQPSKPSRTKRNWDALLIMSNRLNDLRYTAASKWNRQDAESILDMIRDPKHGVLTWLQKQR
jgi:hypothetical protein